MTLNQIKVEIEYILDIISLKIKDLFENISQKVIYNIEKK